MLIALRQVLLTMLALSTPLSFAGAVARPSCTRPLTLALHDHGLLYSAQTGEGIDRDIADEMIRRSGCNISVSVMPRNRIWQLIESGALDFSLTGVTNEARDRFAAFAWYEANRFYLLARKDSGVKSMAEFERHATLRLGQVRGFRYGPVTNRFIDGLDAAHRVTYASALEPLYAVLLDKGVQGVVIGPFDYLTVESAALREQTVLVALDDPPTLHGLIMSRKSLSVVQQEAWRALIAGMRVDGTIERIFQKYFSPEMARALTRF